MLVGSTNQ